MNIYEKKYNDALADMKVIYPNLKGDAKRAVEHAFPELNESEDERVINFLYCELTTLCAKECNEGGNGSDRYNTLVAAMDWLEKQKEQKSEEWSEEELRLLHNAENAVYQVASARIGGYTKKDYEEISSFFGTLRPQPKIEWSEEDKHRLEQAINALGRNGYYVLVDWLKSLRPQHHWKPSDIQMAALNYARTYITDDEGSLSSLYKDLKKLMR